ncbi:MAG TPA: hypothetical protein VL178_14225 [Pseudomonas sp.]|nr:hypothetical protein [Pseudomonas sp.]
MACVNLVAVIRLRWWLRIYLGGVALVSRVTDLEPDWERVERWVKRGMVVRIERRARR